MLPTLPHGVRHLLETAGGQCLTLMEQQWPGSLTLVVCAYFISSFQALSEGIGHRTYTLISAYF